MILVLSTSLHPTSRSRILAAAAMESLSATDVDAEIFDLATTPLPPCDGATAYGHADVQTLGEKIRTADAILIAAPIYNYDVGAALKNAVELTGKAWTGKIVGFMVAAGGAGSYMSVMGIANSLMLDFRCLIVPRFIYATGEHFEGDRLADENITTRVQQLVGETVRLSNAVASSAP